LRKTITDEHYSAEMGAFDPMPTDILFEDRFQVPHRPPFSKWSCAGTCGAPGPGAEGYVGETLFAILHRCSMLRRTDKELPISLSLLEQVTFMECGCSRRR
jgi:hypothetical protein